MIDHHWSIRWDSELRVDVGQNRSLVSNAQVQIECNRASVNKRPRLVAQVRLSTASCAWQGHHLMKILTLLSAMKNIEEFWMLVPDVSLEP